MSMDDAEVARGDGLSGRFRRYQAYRESGVEWLGEIPRNWEFASLKWLSRIYAGGTPDKGNQDYWSDGTIPWLNSGAINQGTVTEPSAYITNEAFSNSSAKWVPEGALLMALAGQGKTKGIVARNRIRTTCNQSMAAIVVQRGCADFFYWWLVAQYRNIRGLSGHDNRDGLNLELVGAIPCPIPSEREQRAIAAFLDRETARIDALIAKKRRLIELLQEKRAALISHAVTRGLDPGVPLKDSGIDWLGQMPAHWDIDRLRRVCRRVTDGAHISPDLSSDDFPFVSTVDIANGRMDFAGCLRTSDECYAYLVRTGCKPFKGDVLFSKDGTVGRTAVVDAERDFVVASSLVIITPKSEALDSRFLNYWLNNDLLQQEVVLQMAGSALRRISVEKVGRLPVALPGLQEQREIADFLEVQTKVLDALTDEIKTAMDRLIEYRASLIAHAVTGKIDVREVVVA